MQDETFEWDDAKAGAKRVVGDDDVGTPPGQYPADRSGDARAKCGRLKLGHLPLRS